jgi:hypothetical protein
MLTGALWSLGLTLRVDPCRTLNELAHSKAPSLADQALNLRAHPDS